jgi:hypothetical protein
VSPFRLFQSFLKAGIDDAPLGGCVFIICDRQFGEDRDDPSEALNSSSWPLLKRARRRMAGGTTSGVLLLFLTATVMVIVTDSTSANFHLHDSSYAFEVNPLSCPGVPVSWIPDNRRGLWEGEWSRDGGAYAG